MGWVKILNTGDAATELTGTAYRLLVVDSAGDVTELAHAAANKVLTSGGASADPTWEDPQAGPTLDAIGDVAAITEAQGQVIFRAAAAWDALDPGTDGKFLQTKGAAADPVWTAAAALTDTVPNVIEPDDSASAGVATDASRRDHEHGIVTATAVAVGTSASEGDSTSFSRANHVHDLGGDCIDSGLLIADDIIDSEHYVAGSIDNEHLADGAVDTAELAANACDATIIDDSATDIALNQIILTPKAAGDGTTEGTIFYDSDDDHLYVYVTA